MHGKRGGSFLSFEKLNTMFNMLIFDGLSAVSIARVLGTSRTTIHSWAKRVDVPLDHGGRGGMMWNMRAQITAGITQPNKPRHFHHLDLHDRAVIQAGRQSNPPLSYRAIARQIGKSPATVSREINRHGLGDRYAPGTYHAGVAHARAMATKAGKPSRGRSMESRWLFDRVVADLKDRFSPQQIAGRLRREYPDDKDHQVSHETIYQALYVQGAGSLREALELEVVLRSGRTQRRRASKLPRKSARPWLAGAMITDRPAVAADRAVPGHWEGDLVVDSSSGGLVTLVERRSRMTLLGLLPGNREALTVAEVVVGMIESLPEAVFDTITWDQGQEMARHRTITVASDCRVFFCDPHSPWQRPTNENTNGLAREYYPKGTKFDGSITSEEVRAVQDQLNRRPRRVLGYATPVEKLAEIVRADVESRNQDVALEP